MGVVNDIKKTRMELIRQLETLMKFRARRDTNLSSDLNKRIEKLETQIHNMTMKHRDEIKKCYSGARKPVN